MLNPLATVAIYGFVFGILFNATAPTGDPSGLKNFALFMLCGLIPWNFFALMNNLGLGAISGNAGLVRRVAFPREILVFANVLHAMVQFGIELALLCLVLLIAGSPLLPWIPLAVLTGLFLAMFGSGFALALSVLAVYFRDMSYLWAILMQVWFFATPIVYPPSQIEGQVPDWTERILELNPMAGFARVFRSMLYDGRAPSWTTWFGVAAVSVVSLALGWAIFLRLAPRLAEEV
jgi:ABC-2 type transport system permease protein